LYCIVYIEHHKVGLCFKINILYILGRYVKLLFKIEGGNGESFVRE